jgi:hypothetical protein
MYIVNEEVVDSLRMKEGVLQGDFQSGDENMTHYPTSMQELLSSTSLLEFKIVHIGKNYKRK